MAPLVLSLTLLAFAAPLEILRSAVAEIMTAAPGRFGVAIEHLETGQAIHVHGDDPFPMASTFKLSLLVALFDAVDAGGKVRLEEKVWLQTEDIHIGSGRLGSFVVPGAAISVANLASLMMRVSDNSAADKLLFLVGPEAVNAKLRSLGIAGIRIERPAQRLILDWLGSPPERTSGMTYREILDFLDAWKPAPGELEAAASAFEEDPRDTATPRAMNELLRAVYLGRAATEGSTRRIQEILLACETGRERIPGRLPEGVAVAHKTGTLGGTVNDVGVILLPDGGGHVLLSVLSRGVPASKRGEAERLIADVARYAYDAFRFH